MAKYTYNINVSMDVGALIRPFGEVIEQINGHMEEFGFCEKLGVRSTCMVTKLSTDRELTEDELNIAKAMLMDVVNEKHPEWLARIENTVIKIEA